MASTSHDKPDPLNFMNRISPQTYLYQPQIFAPTSPTIILLTWMNAAPVHIAFYLQKHRSLFPSARLILVRGTVPNMVYLPANIQKRSLASVLSAIRAEPKSPIYLHLFSNSGAQSTSTLLQAYKESSPSRREQLPINAMFVDSAPSLGTYSSGYAGISYEVTRFPVWIQPLGFLLTHLLVGLMWLVGCMMGRENVLTQSNNDLNDPALVPLDAPRVYLYSVEDRLVRWQDVEMHAAVAERKGWEVRREIFERTGHCRHGKGEPGEGRYWGLVRMIVGQTGKTA
ncbi:MAG: hypothetical protein Q9164_002038 [Protoblastenia rupestris]